MLNCLQSFSCARHKPKRLGRGKSSGHGGTSTKGHKGQKARSGFGLLRGFEGGQIPLVRSLPKFGFTNKRFKKKVATLNLSDLEASLAKEASSSTEVNPEFLYKAGLVKKGAIVKILNKGKLSKALKIKAHYFSKGAMLAIKKAGGQAQTITAVKKHEPSINKK